MLPLLVAALAASSGPHISLQGGTISDEPPSGNAYAGITFNADGTVDKSTSVGGDNVQISTATDWIIPNTDGTAYEVRLLSGHGGDTFDVEAAAEDTWIAMDADREWEHNRVTTGTDSGTYTFEIRIAGVGGARASAAYSISAIKA